MNSKKKKSRKPAQPKAKLPRASSRRNPREGKLVQEIRLSTSRGRAVPLGASVEGNGINFALLCRHGTRVWITFSPEDSNKTFAEIELDDRVHRTGSHWHVHVQGLPAEFRYGWRVDGPAGPEHRFDPAIVLIDPTCTIVTGGGRWGESSESSPHTSSHRSLVRSGPRFEWGNDMPPRTAPEDSIIYELHVRGYTCHHSSGVTHPGTFAGLVEKVSYLKSLGVTAVELLPIHEFDETDCPFIDPNSGLRNRNFWGYNSIAFAAPKAAYAARGDANEQLDEFRDLVRQLHGVGIEVILDVVFNHTAEGDDRGRTYSFRGLDNDLYYLLKPDGTYRNFTGCGNTLNCNHPVVRDMLLNCLRYWVDRVHVDGFRFDLASVLGRDPQGHILVEPPVVESIIEDGVLADTKLIAEPWDAAGVYQLGAFPYGTRWSEWNGKFRDDVRRFWRGDPGTVSALATRICGSPDLYQPSGRKPTHSINFITCHDGFTLNDLVSYSRKHNLANGEDNRDGMNDNFSWNCGVEGPTTDPEVIAVRERYARNLVATLMLSQGVPMLLAGDEFLRTQRGNNNAWCQDNEVSWVDWTYAGEHSGYHRFVHAMISLRKRHPALRRRDFFRGDLATRDISWHGIEAAAPNFHHDSHAIAFLLDGKKTGREDDHDFYVAMNAWREPLEFEVPSPVNARAWRRVVDTFLPSPQDIIEKASAPVVKAGTRYPVGDRSVVVLVSD